MHIRHRSGRLVSEDAGRVLPARWPHASALRQEGDEYLRLLVAEAWQRVQPSCQLGTVSDVGPQRLGPPVVVAGEDSAQGVDAPAHRRREPVYRRLLRADL